MKKIYLLLISIKMISLVTATPLHLAARSGALDKLIRSLETESVNDLDDHGNTALMYAAYLGDFDCARQMLWKGADIQKKNRAGYTAEDFLDPADTNYPLMLVLFRCYTACQKHGKINPRAKNRHHVIVNDTAVDVDHPDLQPYLKFNAREKNGKDGVDDDGNGIVDDSCGYHLGQRKANDTEYYPMGIKHTAATRNALQTWYDGCDSSYYKTYKYRKLVHFKYLDYEKDVCTDQKFYDTWVAGNGHGTHVAGIVAQSGGEGTVICPLTDYFLGVEINAAKIKAKSVEEFVSKFRQSYYESSLKSVNAVNQQLLWNYYHCGIFNASWGTNLNMEHEFIIEKLKSGFKANHLYFPKSGEEGYQLIHNSCFDLMGSQFLPHALVIYSNPDILFVNSAGNDSRENGTSEFEGTMFLSRLFPNIIQVAAVNTCYGDGVGDEEEDIKEIPYLIEMSNWGRTSVLLAADGEDVESSFPFGIRTKLTGTSMAAPIVSGIASAIRRENPHLTAQNVYHILAASVTKYEDDAARLDDLIVTGGVVNRSRALAMAKTWNRQKDLEMKIKLAAKMHDQYNHTFQYKKILPLVYQNEAREWMKPIVEK